MVAHSAVLPFKNYSAIVAIWRWSARTGLQVTSSVYQAIIKQVTDNPTLRAAGPVRSAHSYIDEPGAEFLQALSLVLLLLKNRTKPAMPSPIQITMKRTPSTPDTGSPDSAR